MQLNRGCEKNASRPIWKIKGQDVLRCPIKTISKEVMNLVSMYKSYNKGIMPYNLGYMEHPNIIVEAFDIISSEVNAYEKKQVEKSKSNKGK